MAARWQRTVAGTLAQEDCELGQASAFSVIPAAIGWPPPRSRMPRSRAAATAEPMSKPGSDRAEPLPIRPVECHDTGRAVESLQETARKDADHAGVEREIGRDQNVVARGGTRRYLCLGR